jgi:hypothetical protein
MPDNIVDAVLGILSVAVTSLVAVTVRLYRDVGVLQEQTARHGGLEERLRSIERDLAVIREILERTIVDRPRDEVVDRRERRT